VTTAGTRRSAAARVARAHTGVRLSGFIYGTIVALSVIVAGGRAYPDDAWHTAVVVTLTCTVFWIAHVYAHSLGHSVVEEERVSLDELLRIGGREGSIVEAAVLPVAALLLGAAGVLPDRAALWLAFALGLVVLGAQGVVFARVERLGWLATLVVVAANLGLGLLLVALKLVLAH